MAAARSESAGRAPEKSPNYRFERKFTTDRHPRDVVAVIKNHPAYFREIHRQRRINNIYLDTIGYGAFHANTNGLSQRQKARIRWYGKLLGRPERMTLEFKKKDGLVGYKDSYRLVPFDVTTRMTWRSVLAEMQKSDLPRTVAEHLRGVELSLLNTYERRYFLSRDERYRVTVDWDIRYWHLTRTMNPLIGGAREPFVVIEMKYDAYDDGEAHDIADLFPFRVSRNSKYVAGLLATHPELTA